MHAYAVEWMGGCMGACRAQILPTASPFYNRSWKSQEPTGYPSFPVQHSQWVLGLTVFGSLMPFACQGQVDLHQACRVLRACRSGSWCQRASVSPRHVLKALVGRSVNSECELLKCQGGAAQATSVTTATHLGLSDSAREIFKPMSAAELVSQREQGCA